MQLREAKNLVYYKNKFDKHQNNPKQAWKTTNDILAWEEKKGDTTIKELKLGNDAITSPLRIANCLINEYFRSIGGVPGSIGNSCSKNPHNFNFERHICDK